jgi:hypothetical protein
MRPRQGVAVSETIDRSAGPGDGECDRVLDHTVVFYADEGELAALAVGFLAPALLRDEAAVVIATPAHRALVARALTDVGVDVDEFAFDGRYLVADAETTLAAFLVDGVVQPAGFATSVGALVRAAAAVGGPVRVYAERVGCLWGRADGAAAFALDREWNALAAGVDLRLLTAHPQSLVRAAAAGC